MGGRRTRVAVVAAALVAAAVSAAIARAAQPVVFDHESYTDGPFPTSACGVVAGTTVDRGTFTFRQDANGDFRATYRDTAIFTAAATGKSVEFDDAGVDMGSGVDNGDGTVTFTEHTAGLAVTFRIPNGPLLKDADGKPLIGAGVVDTVATFDETTGDLVSFSETWHGPHPLRDGVDPCTPTVAYLTSA
jgi:hypothetical protein